MIIDIIIILSENNQYNRFMCIQEGKSALILASEGGHEMVMFNLLDGKADVNFKLEV